MTFCNMDTTKCLKTLFKDKTKVIETYCVCFEDLLKIELLLIYILILPYLNFLFLGDMVKRVTYVLKHFRYVHSVVSLRFSQRMQSCPWEKQKIMDSYKTLDSGSIFCVS